MEITFDPKKNAVNIRERQLSFEEVSKLEWSSALIIEDVRRDYGERRFRVFGYIDDRLYTVVFTPRENTVRVISFRKANIQEVKRNG